MRRVDRLTAFFFLLSAVFQLWYMRLDAFFSDEGLVLVAADDVAKGKLLYHDVYVPVTPLAYLIEGIAFKLFGSGMVTSRLLMVGTYATTVALTFRMATACTTTAFASIAGLCAMLLHLWMWPQAHFFSYSPLSLFFSMLALRWAWQLEIGDYPTRYGVGLGAALGLATWAKPNLGVAAGLGVLSYWIIAWLRSVGGAAVARQRTLRGALRDSTWTVVGVGLVSVPLVAYLLATGTLTGMMQSLRALSAIYGDVPPELFPKPFPLTAQLDAIRLDLQLTVPGILSATLMSDAGFDYLLNYTAWVDALVRVIYYAPIAIQIGGVAYLARRAWRGEWLREDDAALLVLLVTVALFLTLLPHAPIHYLVPTQVPGAILASFLIGRSWYIRNIWGRVISRAAAIAALGGYILLSGFMLVTYVSVPRVPVSSRGGTIWLQPATATALNEAVSIANTTVDAHEAIFVVPYYPLFYFLTGLRHATRFIDLRPGSPGEGVEDEIIRELAREQVTVVFYFIGAQYGGLSSFADAYPQLHDYLMKRFDFDREVRTIFGQYVQDRRRRVDAD